MLDPYSASTEEHKLWNEKTRQAQERSARVDAEYIREALLNLTGNPLSHRELYFRRITELFDIWCARTLHFVRTHAEADSFSVWLRKYARDFLCVEFESTQKGVLRGHAELVLEVRICHWNLEARKKVNEAEHLAQVPNFLEMGVTGPGHEAAIALAESRLHAALSGGVPDTALDWDGSPVPICFVLAADYTRTVMEAYAEEVLLPLEPDPSPARYGFCSLSDGHTNYLFDEHFSEDVNFVNQDRRKKRISGEFTGGWYNKDNEARRCRSGEVWNQRAELFCDI